MAAPIVWREAPANTARAEPSRVRKAVFELTPLANVGLPYAKIQRSVHWAKDFAQVPINGARVFA